MNTICVFGGLGNQMFQYALYKAFRKRGIEARLSLLRYLYERHHHGLELWKAFDLPLSPGERACCNLITRLEPVSRNTLCEWLFRAALPRIQGGRQLRYREKEEFRYDLELFQQRNRLIDGIWQVEGYFSEFQDELRREFSFRLPRDPELLSLADRIQGSSSVSIHIRRGDYYGTQYGRTHSVLGSLEYYRHALNCIRERVGDPSFFVFSDDLCWAREHLPLPGAVYVDRNRGDRSYLDMYLMSICKHNVIANSTFSWWGAWLNTNPDKTVIIPEVWIRGKSCPGIYPEGWIRLPVGPAGDAQGRGEK